MTKERLVEIIDLIRKCKHFGTKHRVHLVVDNDGDHEVYVYPYVGNGKRESTVYFCDETRKAQVKNLKNFVFDPHFDAAEKTILALLEAIPEKKKA